MFGCVKGQNQYEILAMEEIIDDKDVGSMAFLVCHIWFYSCIYVYVSVCACITCTIYILDKCQRRIFLLLLLSLMQGVGRKSLKGERERARGEVAGFQNSESGALSQQDFGFSLCTAPEFQV